MSNNEDIEHELELDDWNVEDERHLISMWDALPEQVRLAVGDYQTFHTAMADDDDDLLEGTGWIGVVRRLLDLEIGELR